jgi:hypothetical protein
MISWEDINELRSQIETDSRLLPAAVQPIRPITIKIIQRHRKLNESNAASRNWHKRKSLEFQAAGLNWRGEPYQNERRTRPLVHPDLPPKLYLDHAAYMAAWRAKKKAVK